MRFGSTAKVLLKCKLEYYRISECVQGVVQILLVGCPGKLVLHKLMVGLYFCLLKGNVAHGHNQTYRVATLISS